MWKKHCSQIAPSSTRKLARTLQHMSYRPKAITNRRRRMLRIVIKRRFNYEHGCAAAIENRGIVAEWDARAGRLTVWDTTQAPVVIRNGLADMLGSVGATSPRHCAVHRRRIRSEDHDVLSGGSACPMGGDEVEPSRQMDRGPRRKFCRHHARARTDPRCGDRASTRMVTFSACMMSFCMTQARMLRMV